MYGNKDEYLYMFFILNYYDIFSYAIFYFEIYRIIILLLLFDIEKKKNYIHIALNYLLSKRENDVIQILYQE